MCRCGRRRPVRPTPKFSFDKPSRNNCFDLEILSYRFGIFHLVVLALSVATTAHYVISKQWLLSNVYGEAFSTSAVSLLNLDSFKTGMALLSGLFFYDIFWVFFTPVMVTVAKGLDVPIKVS